MYRRKRACCSLACVLMLTSTLWGASRPETKTLISFGRGLDGVWLPSVVLLGFGLVFSVVGARFLRFD